MRNRGVQDVLLACVDGLKGFPEAGQSVCPGAEVQLGIIRQIRNSLRSEAWKIHQEFMADLKQVGMTTTESKGTHGLNNLAHQWGPRYPLVLNQRNWPQLSPFFKYPQEIRTTIDTNAVENLHRQIRKMTKPPSAFPHDDAL